MDWLSIIGLIKEVYTYIKSQIPAFDNVYDRALRRWTKNSSLRAKFSDNALGDFDKLVRYIEDRASVNQGVVDFFEILLDEATKDPEVASMLSAEFAINSYQQGKELSGVMSEILHTLRELVGNGPDLSVVYKDVEDYIPLTVSGEETREERLRRILSGVVENKTMMDLIIEGKKRLILFGDPQHGKSTVLAKLAFDLQQSGIYNPFLYNLRNYSPSQSLVEQIKLDQRLGNLSSSVLILDGLDELKEDQRDNVVSEITTISANYPLMYIVLSCRLSHKKVMTVSGFESVYLKTIGYDALVRYVNSHSKCPDAFLADAQKSDLMRLLYVPFFLKESIRYFEENGQIPQDQVTIYEYFIFRSFEMDKSRKAHRTGSVTPKAKLYKHLEHMAFAMLASQRMEISPDDLAVSLDMSDSVIEGLIGLSLITRGENGELTFVHNAFKEYILAKRLSQLPTVEIKKLVCFPDTDIIIPALKNVVVLLIHLISKLDSWDYSEFKNWFIDRYPDVLVAVGPECLDEETRQEIFAKIFNNHKAKGLHIDIGYCRNLVNFSMTRRTAELLLDEIEHADSLDANFMNALRLSEYADFSLLQVEVRQKAEEVFLSLLDFKSSRIGDFAYLRMPLTNRSILSVDLIERALSRVVDTTNCYLIQMICSMSVSLGVADKYAHWVLPKAKHVRNYDENGVTHVISNHDLLEFMRALRQPKNILWAISTILPHNRHHYDSYLERDEVDLVPEMLDTLLSSNLDIGYEEVIKVVDSSFMERIPRTISDAFASYFRSVTDADKLFGMRVREVIEASRTENTDFYSVWNMHNLLSILLDEDMLHKIINEDEDSKFDLYYILCHLRGYASRSEEESSIIDSYINRKVPRKHIANSSQAQFDILFNRLEFEKEIYHIFDGVCTIDFDKDIDRLYRSDFNSSVLSFLRDIKDDEDVVSLDEVLCAFQDSEKFKVFIANRVFHSIGESIVLTDPRKASLQSLVVSLIPLCNEWRGLAVCLINIIVQYDLSLSDEELMDLLPWAGECIRQKGDDGISYGRRRFIDYVQENIHDKKLVVQYVQSVINGERVVSDSFHIAVSSYIIRNRVVELYNLFPEIVQKFEYEHEKVNTAIDLLRLGLQGLKMSITVLDYLTEDDKLCFYEHLLLHENKGLVLSDEDKNLALSYVESCYNSYSENMQQRLLRILLAHGREMALDWGFAMFESCESWIYIDDFPTISGYSGKYFDKLSEYFMRATTGDRAAHSRPQPMYESVASALRNIAMESKEMLRKVQNLFRQVAAERKDFRYYNRVADELDVDYQSRNVPPPSLHEASLQYRSICV